MIEVTPSIKIDETEIQLNFTRASGPGGQNVNKVATSVQLRFDARNSPSLDSEVKERLGKLAGHRMTNEGVLIIEAKRYRAQEQNRLDAISRLVGLIQKAALPPKQRKKTRPTITSKAARLSSKHAHAENKRIRQYNPEDWE